MNEKTKDPNRETALSIFRGIMQSKAKDVANFMATEIADGNADPVYIGIMAKKFAKVQEELFKNKDAKESIFEATKLYKEKTATFEVFGTKIQLANTGYWDFSDTEDPYLEKLKEIEVKIKGLVKDREEELKALASAWEKRTSGDGFNRGLEAGSSFIITVHNLPELTWTDAYAEIHTNPPIKRGSETLRYFV